MKPAPRYFYHKSNGKTWTIFARHKDDIVSYHGHVDIWYYFLSIEPQTVGEERIMLLEGEIACVLDAEPSVEQFISDAKMKMHRVFLAFATNHVTVLG